MTSHACCPATMMTDQLMRCYVRRPAYRSFKALNNPAPDDANTWLTYWIVHGFLSVFESILDKFIFWVRLVGACFSSAYVVLSSSLTISHNVDSLLLRDEDCVSSVDATSIHARLADPVQYVHQTVAERERRWHWQSHWRLGWCPERHAIQGLESVKKKLKIQAMCFIVPYAY